MLENNKNTLTKLERLTKRRIEEIAKKGKTEEETYEQATKRLTASTFLTGLPAIGLGVASAVTKNPTFGICATAATTVFTAVSLSSILDYKFVGKQKNNKTNKYYKNSDLRKADEFYSIIDFIELLKQDEPSLLTYFLKKFLNEADISENSNSFNLTLINKLRKYKQICDEQDSEEREKKAGKFFESLADFLYKSKDKNGVSKQFIESQYIQGFMEQYSNKKKKETKKAAKKYVKKLGE